MKSSQLLTLEIKKLNQQLDAISKRSRFMIFSANPAKFALYNFLAGAFHSLGSLLATAIIFVLMAYFASQVDLVKPAAQWMEEVFTQIQWDKFTPSPTPKQ